MSRFQNNKNRLLKEKCLKYLGGKKCKKCSNDYLPICCYDFHHKVGTKETTISEMINKGEKFINIKKELDKCVILCANCHREVHYFKVKII